MFEGIENTPLFGANLVAANFKADFRGDKIDLGLGVYRDENGATPVLDVVKLAEAHLVQNQTSKSYQGLLGDPEYAQLMLELVLGKNSDTSKIAVLQTPGGVAALSIAFQLIQSVRPEGQVWISDPTWANHAPVMEHTGLSIRKYPYFDVAMVGLDFDGMMACLSTAAAGDTVLLQASCHNPTGVDLAPGQWDAIIDVCKMQRLMPMIDIAYQGFGQGLEADVYGPRRAFQELHEAVLTTTCSKNFGVYRDRVAIAAVQTKSPENAARTLSRLTRLANVTYAMPADHAAAVVKTILTDEGLKWAWETELTTMRERIHSVRNSLAKALRGATNSDRFDFLERHKGMFSLLPLTDTQIDTLQNEHGIYLVKGGRANIAGLTKRQIEQFATAVAQVITN